MAVRTLIFFCLVCFLSVNSLAESSEESIHKGSLESRVNTMASLQPSLGEMMHEIANRAAFANWAANGGNWGLAQYEVEEWLEALEKGGITEPEKAGMLNAFGHSYVLPLKESIEKKNLAQFNKRFASTVKGCNACHTAVGNNFIKYQVPTKLEREILDFNLKTEPSHDEEKE